MKSVFDAILDQVHERKITWLFLDYDGTLDELASSPEIVTPKQTIIQIITHLTQQPLIHVAVISGRRLEQVQELLPIPNLLLAGNYGIEMLLASGEKINRVEYTSIRPTIDQVKPLWQEMIADRQGFFLEDKGYALALHASQADADEASEVLAQARKSIKDEYALEPFKMNTGYRFLEIGPVLANKGETVRYLLTRFGKKDDLPVYMGDDERDEEAFQVIKKHNGYVIQVGRAPRSSVDEQLGSPKEALAWLTRLHENVISVRQKQNG
jgi:trehalose 6-phosphate phosphatase